MDIPAFKCEYMRNDTDKGHFGTLFQICAKYGNSADIIGAVNSATIAYKRNWDTLAITEFERDASLSTIDRKGFPFLFRAKYLPLCK